MSIVHRLILSAICVITVLVAISAVAAPQQRRVALIIGNATYAHATKLGSPIQDATAVEAALKRLKFDVVIRLTDLSVKPMADALTRFRREALGADVAIVYYSGHGIEIDGTNYLVPVDATLDDPSDAGLQAIALPNIMRQLDGVRGLRMVVLDACRDNPFQQRLAALPGQKNLAAGKGFVAVKDSDLGQRTVVAFAAREGTTAQDRPGRLSTYTEALVRHIETSGLELRLLLGKISDDVREMTGGKQIPQEYGALGGQPLYLVPEAKVGGAMSTAAGEWQDVKGSSNRRVLEAFLARHKSDPLYSALAEQAIAALEPVKSPPPPPPACGGVEIDVAGSGKRCLEPTDANKREFQDCFTVKGKRVCGPQMVTVPTGKFLMGSTDDEAGRDKDEGPQREVRIQRMFAVGVTHVNRGQFAAFVEATGHKTDGGCRAYDGKEWKDSPGASWRAPGFDQDDSHPVVCVNWNDAQAYVGWLKQSTGNKYRLLTEAEAEYVARATTTASKQPRYFFGDDAKDLCRYGNGADLTGAAKFNWDKAQVATCTDGFVHTAPVGSFAANVFGVKDVHGNAWSWTQDCFVDSYKDAPSDGTKAVESPNCTYRVVRGGSWCGYPQDLRSANRIRLGPVDRFSIQGFRVARSFGR